MRKHILDRPAAPSRAGLRRVMDIERNALPQKASLMLQRRHRTGNVTSRLVRFAGIERHTRDEPFLRS